MGPWWDPREFRRTPALETGQRVCPSLTRQPWQYLCLLTARPAGQPSPAASLVGCGNRKLPSTGTFCYECGACPFRAPLPHPPPKLAQERSWALGQARPGSPGNKAELVVSWQPCSEGGAAGPVPGDHSPAGEGRVTPGEGERGLSSCVWDKGPPCSQETHVSNWILAAALWERLLGERKGNPRIQGCCPPQGHLVALPAWPDAGPGWGPWALPTVLGSGARSWPRGFPGSISDWESESLASTPRNLPFNPPLGRGGGRGE